MEFSSKFGLGEIVIRESHKNGVMVQERMMEIIAISFAYDGVCYVCEDAQNGHRQGYTEDMLVGDPDFDQYKGAYPIEVLDGDSNRPNKELI